ncbi:MAG: hypothetical protein R3Y50_03335 [Rikenellaceae bacterium]
MKKFLIVVLCAISLSSCIEPEKIHVKKFAGIEKAATGSENLKMNLKFVVDNGTSAFKLSDTKIDAVINGDVAIRLWVDDKVKVKRGTNEVVLPLRMKISGGLLGALSIIKNVDKMKFNVSTKASSFILSKNYIYNDLSAKELKNIVGYDIVELFKKAI